MIQLKSQREIDLMRESADLVGRTLGKVAEYIQPGATLEELDAIAEDFIRTHDAEPAFKGYQVGDNVFPGTLCTSVNDVVVHGIPNDYTLQEGDLLSVDCGVKLNGYYGDSAYTFAVGEIDDAAQALCQTTYRALHLGIEQAIVGNRIGDIGHAVDAYCSERGYGVVRDLVGHGIGKELHEKPQIPNFGKPGSGRKLKRGLTVCIEPMVNQGTASVDVDADGWTIRAADGKPSAHYEHMIAVDEDEPQILTTFDYIEDVVDPPYETKTSVTHNTTANG
ncbi:type I methionyl aminopeptidase [Longibacter salinarum]|uniref:Methionine aminopeptidase n=1 Tax=Longibacter salinarum TaxID=1850348 RepID=A0A2A8D389_9BACT|nr:type I methionyl aminopeptidase [Longibacter salinarum]PEN15416.1 type I methionyl aminopeptidase [Longibacter salinarum]